MRKAIGDQLSAVSFGGTLSFTAAMLLFANVACGPPSEERHVKNAVSAFYDVYMKVRPSGVPTKEQQVEFKKVISIGLAGLLDAASTGEESSFRETRIEGDLFSSLDQGALSYKTLQCEIKNTPAACEVELTSVDNRNNSKLVWKDRVFVIREGERWVVDDIEFLGDRPFMHKGRLKDVLKAIIEDAKNADL
jgi:hypothetical protein